MYIPVPVHVKGVLLRCVHVLVMFYREPEGLKLLVKLYVERSYSVWKEPEVCVVYTVVGKRTLMYIYIHCCVSQTTRHCIFSGVDVVGG